jgi:hypothetical protein
VSLVVSLHLGREDERGGGGVPSVAALAAAAAASAIKTNQSCTVCWNSALGMLTDETTSTLQKQLTCSRLQQPAGGAAHRKLAGDLDTAEAANQQPAPACCGRRGGGWGGYSQEARWRGPPTLHGPPTDNRLRPAGRVGRARSSLALFERGAWPLLSRLGHLSRREEERLEARWRRSLWNACGPPPGSCSAGFAERGGGERGSGERGRLARAGRGEERREVGWARFTWIRSLTRPPQGDERARPHCSRERHGSGSPA